jgi:hypothetical protein
VWLFVVVGLVVMNLTLAAVEEEDRAVDATEVVAAAAEIVVVATEVVAAAAEVVAAAAATGTGERWMIPIMVGTAHPDEEATTGGRAEMIPVVVDSPAREEAAKEATAPPDAVLSDAVLSLKNIMIID